VSAGNVDVEVAEFERHVLGRRLGVVIEAEHQVAVRVEPLLALRVREDHASVDREDLPFVVLARTRVLVTLHGVRSRDRIAGSSGTETRRIRGSHGHNVARLLTFRADRTRRCNPS
jgi:hypothetical protein